MAEYRKQGQWGWHPRNMETAKPSVVTKSGGMNAMGSVATPQQANRAAGSSVGGTAGAPPAAEHGAGAA